MYVHGLSGPVYGNCKLLLFCVITIIKNVLCLSVLCGVVWCVMLVIVTHLLLIASGLNYNCPVQVHAQNTHAHKHACNECRIFSYTHMHTLYLYYAI